MTVFAKIYSLTKIQISILKHLRFQKSRVSTSVLVYLYLKTLLHHPLRNQKDRSSTRSRTTCLASSEVCGLPALHGCWVLAPACC
jgi:hypothetical protein